MENVTKVSIAEVSKSCANLDYSNSHPWIVWAVYLNTCSRESPLKEPYGLVIPCGTFATREEAQMRIVEVVAVGASYVTISKSGMPMELSVCPRRGSVMVDTASSKTYEDLASSIAEGTKQKEKQLRASLAEVDKRKDSASIASLVQMIHMVSANSHANARIVSNINKLIAEKPEFVAQWETSARTTLIEMGEPETLQRLLETAKSIEALW